MWFNKGYALDELGRYDEAIQNYDRVLELDDKYVYAWNGKGSALYNLGKYKEAIHLYDKAIEIDGKHASAWYNKGNALEKLGKHKEGKECYERATFPAWLDLYAYDALAILLISRFHF